MSKTPSQDTEKDQNDEQTSFLGTLKGVSFLKRPKIEFRSPNLSLPNRDPRNFFLIVILLITFFLMAGGLYNLANAPSPMGYSETGYQPIYPGLNHQFLMESLTAAMFFAIGAAGLYLLQYATRYAYEIRSATALIGLSALLIFVGIIGTILLLNWKTTL